MPSDTKNYVLGKGQVFFNPFEPDTTNPTGERYLGNTPALTLNVESETLDHFDSDQGVRSKDASVILELNRSGTITTDNISEENVGLFVLGEVSDVTQTATPVVDESLGNALPDRYYQLGESTSNPQGVRNVSAVSLVYDPGNADTALVENTDYTIDLDLARVYFIEGGAVDGSAEVHVDYTPEANTRKRITTSASVNVKGSLRFVSRNPEGKQKDIFFPSVSLAPTGELPLKGDDWQTMSFTYEVNELPGSAAMYIDGRPLS